MKILVLSNRHHLLPLTNNLINAKHDVTLVVLKDRYEICLDDSLKKALKGKQKSAETYKNLFNEVREADGIVVTDSRKMTQASQEAGCVTYGVLNSSPATTAPNLLLVGWFDGEHHRDLALAIPDWGLWPGGMGPFVLGGISICRWKSSQLGVALGPVIPSEQMKSDSFHGMFAAYLTFDGNGFSRIGYGGGWMPIISHAFTTSFNYEMLKPNLIVDKMHTVSLPVSVPPYPLECNYRSNPAVLDNELMTTPGIDLHDVTDAEDALRTAGTDGLVSVVSSSADRLSKARQGALQLASTIRLPQVQWRADVGVVAEKMLDLLEDYGL